MNLQQIRYLCAVVDHGLNVSDAADALFTSQPGISKQIRQLEDEAGPRRCSSTLWSKRLTSMTPTGEVVVANCAARAARGRQHEAGGRRVSRRGRRRARHRDHACTRRRATYCRACCKNSRRATRRCACCCARATPAGWPSRHRAARRISRSPLKRWSSTRNSFRCPTASNRCVLVQRGHPLAKAKGPLTLESLAEMADRHLRLCVHRRLADQRGVHRARARAQHCPDGARLRRDQDVRRAHGMGVGIVAQMAYDPRKDAAFEAASTRPTCSPPRPRALRSGAGSSCAAMPTR